MITKTVMIIKPNQGIIIFMTMYMFNEHVLFVRYEVCSMSYVVLQSYVIYDATMVYGGDEDVQPSMYEYRKC